MISVFPNLKRKLHTTHSWDFMGLMGNEAMEIPGHSTENQENVIVGFIDTGEVDIFWVVPFLNFEMTHFCSSYAILLCCFLFFNGFGSCREVFD